MLSQSCARSRLKVPHENTLTPLARFLRASYWLRHARSWNSYLPKRLSPPPPPVFRI